MRSSLIIYIKRAFLNTLEDCKNIFIDSLCVIIEGIYAKIEDNKKMGGM